MMKDPVFLIYNPKLETELHTDASWEGYGAILMQKSIEDQQLHPVHYMSRKTTSAEKNYSSYELSSSPDNGIKEVRNLSARY